MRRTAVRSTGIGSHFARPLRARPSPWSRAGLRTVVTAGFLLTAACRPAEPPPPPSPSPPPPQEVLADHPAARAVDTYLSRLVPFGWSGSALIARDGEVLLDRGYGLADDARGVPNTAATVHSMGSVTKQFTAAAILALEEEGRLTTADTLGRFFPDAPADKRDVTLHQLLTHTAGIVNYTGGDYEAASRERMVATAFGEPLLFTPGEEFQYSNAGYSLLAAVVEIASGMPYERYLRTRLLAPAGLERTGYELPAWEGASFAHAYAGGRDHGANPEREVFPSWNLLGNGELLSTTGDLYRWHQALLGEALLSAASRRKLYTPVLDDYAYGWQVEQTAHGLRISHNGGSDTGSGTTFRRYPESGAAVIAFSNRDSDRVFFGAAVPDALEALLFGEEVAMPPAVPPVTASAPRPEAVNGTWALTKTGGANAGGRLVAEAAGGGLTVRAEGRDAVSALVYGADEPAELAALAARSEAALAYLVSGDFAAFAGELPEPERRARYRRFLDAVLADVGAADGGGRPAAVEAVSVLPTPVPFGDWIVVLRLSAAGGESLGDLALYWRDGRVSAMGGGGPGESGGLEMRFVPAADGFLGYDPVSRITCRLRPAPGGDEILVVAEPTAGAAAEPVRFRRVGGDG